MLRKLTVDQINDWFTIGKTVTDVELLGAPPAFPAEAPRRDAGPSPVPAGPAACTRWAWAGGQRPEPPGVGRLRGGARPGLAASRSAGLLPPPRFLFTPKCVGAEGQKVRRGEARRGSSRAPCGLPG